MRWCALSLQFKKLPRNLENLGKGVLSCKACFFFSSTLSAHNIVCFDYLVSWKMLGHGNECGKN